MNSKHGLMECGIFLTLLACLGRADDFGITHKTFRQIAAPALAMPTPKLLGDPPLPARGAIAGLSTVFTLRNGRLIHEVTQFDATQPFASRWVERFYADGQLAGLRTGVGAQWSSLHFTRAASMERSGDRLTVGDEFYDLGKDGLYHVVADRAACMQASVITSAIFSTSQLDKERRKYLDPAALSGKFQKLEGAAPFHKPTTATP